MTSRPKTASGIPALKSRLASDLTPRQEAFAQLVARGETLSAAYRATYSAGGKASTINVSASTLMKNPKVRDRVEMLLKQQEQAMHRDAVAIRRHVFGGLMTESRNTKAKPSERIAALVALGKIDIVSMFREVRTVEDRTERKPEEVEAELRSKLRELLRGNVIDVIPSKVGIAPDDKSSGPIEDGEQRDNSGIGTKPH